MNKKLVYINQIGLDSSGNYEYEFFFSETPDIVWGEDWNEQCPSACENTLPDESTYSEIKLLRTKIPISCSQNNTCFSLQDMIDGILACGWEDISEYDKYPEPYRLVFRFGEDKDKIIDKLSTRGENFINIGKNYDEEENFES